MTRKHGSSSQSASYYPATDPKPKHQNRIPKQKVLKEEDDSNYSVEDVVESDYNSESQEDGHQQFKYEIEEEEVKTNEYGLAKGHQKDSNVIRCSKMSLKAPELQNLQEKSKITFKYPKGTLKYLITLRLRFTSDNSTKDIVDGLPQSYSKVTL
ncbi:hypothetical protein KIW84_075636 [Lathyrus oleraceus]|uniref:Uncharacterized protein n=1 Tax=Pisum sativum TaxID=3888 RepID=A0A9D4VVU8_PEA|nr:hypothetical protein KIW84_075636 [Pisum sativum]